MDLSRGEVTKSVRTVVQRGPKGNQVGGFQPRHSAFHTLDHAWEMEDKDLSPERSSQRR